jgi:predicted nucleic acid-binding protein
VKKVFLDSDIILDSLLQRPPFDLHAMNLIALAPTGRIDIVTSSIAFINVNYFLNKFDKTNKSRLLKGLRSVISIAEVGELIIDAALNSSFLDFEDAIQYFTAISTKADVIITRNSKDYKQASIPVMTAEQFLNTL